MGLLPSGHGLKFEPDLFTSMELPREQRNRAVVCDWARLLQIRWDSIHIAPDAYSYGQTCKLEGREGASYWQEKYPGSQMAVICGLGLVLDRRLPRPLGWTGIFSAWTKYMNPIVPSPPARWNAQRW